ncbi:c-type cytochrome [Mixta tenebrionis]|uniref:Cytochrome c n=1 Tax=Mixta tenebrionis TaxID=2562439 RepID=A0A506VEX0_9GAMM|nr:cytochrome c [Mixta tenebrionis]TPW44367.1 cytochrome c [Mixta tenebrionis]
MRLRLSSLGLLLALSGSAQAMSHGEYVARAADCVACHSAENGAPLAGGVAFSTPVGAVYATNITPDREYGIGNYSFEDFDRAMRQGIAKDGHHLYPAMPYTAYAKMSETDMRALYQWLMHEVPAQPVANRDSDIPWPLSMRWPLALWNQLFHRDEGWQSQAQQSERWNRGAYLVEGPGHCGSCHTPRGWAMQEQALDNGDARYLSGAELDGWYAPSLRGLAPEETVSLLKTGHSARSAIAGPMGEVVRHSTQYLTDEDLQAIAVYLRSLPAAASGVAGAPAASVMQAGRQTYAMYCSTCHGAKGEGVPNVIPALSGNTALTADNPLTALRVVLDGAQTPVTAEHMAQTMPGYGWTLSDRQAADLMSYLRGSWGNQAAPVTVQQVGQARQLNVQHR